MKKILIALLALLTVFALVSCGPKEVNKPEKVALENVYLAKKVPITDEADLYGIITSGDKIYFNGNKEVKTVSEDGEENTEWQDCIYVANSDISEIKEVYTFKSDWGYDEETETDYGSYLNGYYSGKDGTLWLSFSDYKSWHDEYSGDYMYEERTKLKRLNSDGSITDEIDVNSVVDTLPEFADDSYGRYINTVFETSEGNLIVSLGDGYLLIIDSNGNFVKLSKMPDDKYANDMAMINDDILRITTWDWSGDVSKMDIIDYSISKDEFKTIDSIPTYHSVIMSDDASIYINDYNVISKYDFEKKEQVPILDFINSDINSDRISQLYSVGNDEFYTFEYDANWEKRELLRLTPAAKGEVVEKYVITLAANTLDSQLKNMIIDYNRSSKDYRISVKVYGWEEKDTEQFDLDLLSGKTPDIVCIDSSLSLSKYATKGIFADMGLLLDADKEIGREALLSNVLTASEVNGKIYSLPVSFAVRSMMMKKSLVGDRTSLTFNDLKSLMASIPGSAYLREVDREQIMNNFLPDILEEFIDYKNNKANFSSSAFASFLELTKAFPAKIDYDTYYGEIDWDLYNSDFKDNRVLANMAHISSFEGNEWYEEEFGEEFKYIGYPTDKGEPHALVFNSQFAIGAKSSYKEEAWNFMKMLLGKEYQDEYVWNFPVNKEAFEKMKEEAITSTKSRYEKESMEDDEYFDDDFMVDDDMVVMPRADFEYAVEDVEYTEEIIAEDSMIGVEDLLTGVAKPMPFLPAEEEEFDSEKLQKALEKIEEVYTIATTTTRLVRTNDPILDIISSDVGAYFDSKKSAEEIGKTIESRVNLYLSENS